MMSLLLTFFILLAALSELKKEDEFRSVMEEVRQSLGSKGGGGRKDNTEDPALTLMKLLEELQRRQHKEVNESNSTEVGVHGQRPKVTTLREDEWLIVGGRVTFEPGSADLSDEAKARLKQAASHVRGWNNKLEIRGHAEPLERDFTGGYPDVWALSYARARAVMEYMTRSEPELGLKPERFRVVSCGDQEPVVQREYEPIDTQPTRRVEIVVIDTLVQEVQKAEPTQ